MSDDEREGDINRTNDCVEDESETETQDLLPALKLPLLVASLTLSGFFSRIANVTTANPPAWVSNEDHFDHVKILQTLQNGLEAQHKLEMNVVKTFRWLEGAVMLTMPMMRGNPKTRTLSPVRRLHAIPGQLLVQSLPTNPGKLLAV